MNHSEIWEVIDIFAATQGKSVSCLARNSGLDATTFNRSKRFTRYGQERWPSTGSISKVLYAHDSDIMDMLRIYLRNKAKK